MKKISAVMITGMKRGIEGLPEMAVQCFLNQTYPNRELVVLNHGTKNFSGKNIRDIKIKKEENQHIGYLRNLAFDFAEGELICVTDDDDWQAPDRMAYQAERTPDGRMSLLKNRIVHDLEAGESIIKTTPVGFGSTMLYPRNTENRYENWTNNSDGWFRCMFFDKVLIDNPPELYIYNHHGKNLTSREIMMTKPKEEIPLGTKSIGRVNEMREMLQLQQI